MNKNIQTITAYQTTDGEKFLKLDAAELRQKIIDAGNKPCNKCECTGKVFRYPNNNPSMFGGWDEICDSCNGYGYLVLKWEPLSRPASL